MITKIDFINTRERIVEDLLCILDGCDQGVLDNVCRVVVKRLNMLEEKLYTDFPLPTFGRRNSWRET